MVYGFIRAVSGSKLFFIWCDPIRSGTFNPQTKNLAKCFKELCSNAGINLPESVYGVVIRKLFGHKS